jgi:ferredoxin-NADP reductase
MIAGGVGVTPFRSMIRDLLDKQESRDCVHLYSNKATEEIAFREIFTEAETKLGVKTIYIMSEQEKLSAESLPRLLPDFSKRLFYISGPRGFVESIQTILQDLGVARANIKTDFFPGLV